MRFSTVVMLAVVVAAGCSTLELEQNERHRALGIICERAVTLTGSIDPGAPAPLDAPGGCWGDGTWSFKAQVTEEGCGFAPTLEEEYKLSLSHDGELNQLLVYENDPDNADVVLRVSADGAGVCEGQVTLFSPDGKTVWNLKPHLFADGHIEGQGHIAVYREDQR
jgi:hypothetical protein